MSDVTPQMPEAVANAFIPTLDRQGAVWLYVDEVTQAYLDFAAQTKGTMLEIAAGYGHIVIERRLNMQASWYVAWESFPSISTSLRPPSTASTMPGSFTFFRASVSEQV